MANSNELVRSLTGVYLRQDTATQLEMGLCVLRTSATFIQSDREKKGGHRRKGRQGRNWLILGGARVGREKKGARERPSLKGSVLASQPSHHFNALSCSDVSLCMVLPRPLFPLSSMFLASSQLNAHWNRREEVPHWALHNVERGADERTCLF